MIFILLVGYITFVAVLCMSLKKNKSINIFLIMSFLAIGALISLRSTSVGSDTANYYRMYTRLSYGKLSEQEIEIGFVILIRALRLISINPQTLFIFQGVLVSFSFAFFIKRNVESMQQAYIAVLGFLAFNLFSFHLTGVRQSIALCFCLLAYEIIKVKNESFKNNLLRFFGFFAVVLLASTFHTSALLFIPAYFLVRTNEKGVIFIVAVISAMGLFSTNFLMEIFTSMSDRYDSYGVEETGNGYIFFAIMSIILLFYILFKRYIIKKNDTVMMHAKLNYLNYGIWAVRLVTRVVERVSFYYMPSTIILLTHTPKVVSKKEDNIFFTLVLSLFLIVLFIYRMMSFKYSFC